MSYESKSRIKASRILAALVCAVVALSACTPTTENPMIGSSSSSDPATVNAQVEELKQALSDLRGFKTETENAVGPQTWADESLRNMDCSTPEGEEGVNYSVVSQTLETLDMESSVNVVKTFWKSKGFTTRVESNPKDPGNIRLYANKNGGHLVSFTATTNGLSLEMNSACVAGNQHEIYKEWDRQEASASPTPSTKES
ncbi:hypothetical protein J2790_002652 [Paenarthrobacter nicotinovorans]|uniref:hypothetical protein n=1 Tax=Micrococcaceae TaxID=1268 RepID=UPI0008772C67|nr:MULTISPECIES: hypothetical protein [Micrococcaceae]MDR6437503.1 hypothetical protein [Paenarthrobacter nicotinovorans]SCZ60552.1 hypothetical protein SAMN02799638_02938 [Arthrobacter sp. UNCCL28]